MVDGLDMQRIVNRLTEYGVSVPVTVNQAVPILQVGNAGGNPNAVIAITKTSACALTLAAPIINDQELIVFSATNYAHTLTATGLLATASAAVNVATFAAFAGASLSLRSYNGLWILQTGAAGITFS
jgi:hypothetical protein